VDDLIRDIARHAGRNRKTHTLITARSAHDRRVDSDQTSFRRHQCPTGVTWIDGSVGLNEIFIIFDANIASSSAYNPHRDGLPYAERIPDGQNYISDSNLRRVVQR